VGEKRKGISVLIEQPSTNDILNYAVPFIVTKFNWTEYNRLAATKQAQKSFCKLKNRASKLYILRQRPNFDSEEVH